MTAVPDRNTFESAYAGQAPWDIGRPQKALLDVADRITGSVLDAGCGTGENALFFAGRGCTVTGIDFLEEPINRARRKATERGLPVTFLVKDALTLKDWTERFDNVIDSGLFHVFSDEDRRRYVEGLATRPEAGRAAVPVVLQRRGAGDARAEAGVEGGTVRRLRRGLGRRVGRADQGRHSALLKKLCILCAGKWPLGKKLSILKMLVNLVSILSLFRAKTWFLERIFQDVKPL